MKRFRGFTLIELLIVVLIIAILAAIAVPNFLEFQTRAKVSRALTDMRSMATAIEAYRVDQDIYPFGPRSFYNEEGNWPGSVVHSGYNTLFVLTTPISYMTTVAKDVFVESILFRNNSEPGKYYEYEAFTPMHWDPDGQYPGHMRFVRDYAGIGAEGLHDLGYTWGLASVGPKLTGVNGDHFQGWNWASVLSASAENEQEDIYDPTNGTVSNGIVLRTNQGGEARQGSEGN